MTTFFLVALVLLIIIFNLLLIPKFGMTGAAAASCFAVLIHNIIKFSFIRSKFQFYPYNYQFLLVLVFAALIFALVSILPDIDNFILEILMDSAITIILFYLAIRFLPIAKEANQFINQIIMKGLKIFRSKIK